MSQELDQNPMTALQMICESLTRAKDRAVIERRGRWYTGQQILERMYARALDMKHTGVKPTDNVIIIVSDNLCAVEQLLACWVNGASGVFIDFRTPSARILQCAQQLSANMIFGLKTVEGVSIHLQDIDPDQIGFPTNNLPQYPDNIAIYNASSGTTGAPRFAPTGQARLAINLDAANKARDWDCPGAALSSLSVGYSASSYLWLTKLAVGEPIVALDLVHRLSELDSGLKRADVSEAGLTPSQLRRLLKIDNTTDQISVRYPQLTNLCSVGGPASPQEKRGAATRLSNSYRMLYSAVGIGKIARIMGEEVKQKPASVGRPEPHLSVNIFDGVRECEEGEIGEVSISSTEFTDKRPGDMGYFDEDGYLYITGRIQGLLCRNGVNFNSERLTQAVLAQESISNAEVISRPDADQGDIVYLVFEGQENQIEDLWQNIRKKLPLAEQPDHVIAVDVIPTTASMKNDLVALRQLILETGDDN